MRARRVRAARMARARRRLHRRRDRGSRRRRQQHTAERQGDELGRRLNLFELGLLHRGLDPARGDDRLGPARPDQRPHPELHLPPPSRAPASSARSTGHRRLPPLLEPLHRRLGARRRHLHLPGKATDPAGNTGPAGDRASRSTPRPRTPRSTRPHRPDQRPHPELRLRSSEPGASFQCSSTPAPPTSTPAEAVHRRRSPTATTPSRSGPPTPPATPARPATETSRSTPRAPTRRSLGPTGHDQRPQPELRLQLHRAGRQLPMPLDPGTATSTPDAPLRRLRRSPTAPTPSR